MSEHHTRHPAGILLLDKPEGPTSFQVIAKLRRILQTRAIGHAGTLDPLATGLLVILVGNYTRLSQHLTAADKEYIARVTFGVRTSTDDREGEPIEQASTGTLNEAMLRDALHGMLGEQEQVPPAYSAISVDGERLYAKARRGEQVEVPSRKIRIHALRWRSFSSPQLEIEVHCSKGTYVRAIARDLGERVGVPAHLGGLRRTRSGAYSLVDSVTLEELENASAPGAYLRSGPAAIQGIPVIQVDSFAAQALEHGKAIEIMPGLRTGLSEDTIVVAAHGDALVALVQRRGESFRPVRGLGRC